MNLLCFIEKFQSGITGIIGFSGVVITLIVNAWLSRKRVDDSREYERKLVCAALKGELNSYLITLRHNLNEMDPNRGPNADIFYPRISTPIFDANVSKIGHLPEDVLTVVLAAFLTLKELDRSLTLFSHNTSEMHHQIPNRHAQRVVGMLNSLVPTMEAGISALDRIQ